MSGGTKLAVAVADAAARVALRFRLLERVLVAGTRRPLLRRYLRLGAIALGYPRVLGRRELRIAEMDGYRFYVNVGESLGVAPYFFHDSGTAWVTPKLLRPEDVCVDAGANAGHYTFFCASIVGSRGKVYAFEPSPEFSALLRKSVSLNGFEPIVQLDERALWSSTEQAKRFYVSTEPTNTGTSSLVDHGWFLSPASALDVPTVRFDDFVGERGLKHIRLVKVDVERAEDAVIEGASRTLAEKLIDYLIVEMHAGGRAQGLLQAAGYDGFLIEPEARRLIALHQVEHDRFGDYLFVRAGLTAPDA